MSATWFRSLVIPRHTNLVLRVLRTFPRDFSGCRPRYLPQIIVLFLRKQIEMKHFNAPGVRIISVPEPSLRNKFGTRVFKSLFEKDLSRKNALKDRASSMFSHLVTVSHC